MNSKNKIKTFSNSQLARTFGILRKVFFMKPTQTATFFLQVPTSKVSLDV